MNKLEALPAIRSVVGNWTYYISSMTFEDITTSVKRVDDELHKSKFLREQIQRAITDNYLSIKRYLIAQEERFFNALVLAVYDGDPKWIEVELDYKDKEFFNVGFLEFNGEEKIFPLDGQHRVEGIKAALKEKPELATERIPIILIGHKNSDEGMQRSRRLFTTLNRHAKPVKMNDIIALDEDDIVAIATRELIENEELFADKRLVNSQTKSISESDKQSITSIINLYQCNLEIFKYFISKEKSKVVSKKFIDEFLKIRPTDQDIDSFMRIVNDLWTAFKENIDPIKKYITIPIDQDPSAEFRNSTNGGILLFRPVGLYPFIQAVMIIKKTNPDIEFKEIMQKFNNLDFRMDQNPWQNLVWNSVSSTMIMGKQLVTKLLLVYIFDKKILNQNQLERLRRVYASEIQSKEEKENVLNTIKTI